MYSCMEKKTINDLENTEKTKSLGNSYEDLRFSNFTSIIEQNENPEAHDLLPLSSRNLIIPTTNVTQCYNSDCDPKIHLQDNHYRYPNIFPSISKESNEDTYLRWTKLLDTLKVQYVSVGAGKGNYMKLHHLLKLKQAVNWEELYAFSFEFFILMSVAKKGFANAKRLTSEPSEEMAWGKSKRDVTLLEKRLKLNFTLWVAA
ncbi:hypothetical protein WN51_12011 [Melipona quadrifasciata]|uniref:Uncharacterized protein n=1 Tax=Melipona quadrifasciata TaxID=166423 RepID=A0A0N0BH42_9HYME|nr:hypothetical protein WN51_12011 [Melipona quadrifasciata]